MKPDKITVIATVSGYGSRMYKDYESIPTIQLKDLKDENGNDLLRQESFNANKFLNLNLKKGDKISFIATQKKTLSDILKLSNPTSIKAYRG